MDATECSACPVCVLLRTLSTAKPEVTLHFAAAVRELALAVHALLEPGVPAPAAESRFERIRID